MLKKMVIVAAILAMTGTVFGAWSANKFSTSVPQQMIPDANGVMQPNPAYADFDKANYGTDRTVDWESDGNNIQRKGESWNWPASYDFIPICDIRVQMDVGFWIKITGCKDNIIKLKQRMINQYGGQTTCKVYTNVDTEWKATFIKKDTIDFGGDWDKSAAVDPSTLPNTKGAEKVITIKLKIWSVDLKNLPAGTNCLDVGVVRVQVRPTVRPNVFINNACGGTYPVYAPPTDDSAGKSKGYDTNVTWW
jgi:hypothetical protein